MAGSNRRPSRYKHAALPTELMELIQDSIKIIINSDFLLGFDVRKLKTTGWFTTGILKTNTADD